MLTISNKKIIADFTKCQQCGTCEAVCPTKSITLKLRASDGLSDVVIDHDTCVGCNKCVKCCPATVVDNVEGYETGLSSKQFFFAYNSDERIRHNSSSGGAARTLIVESLISGRVDGVYTLRKSDTYPFAEGHLFTKDDLPTYATIPNSLYHSVMIGRNIRNFPKCDRLMIVGTTCQLKALRVALKGRYRELVTVNIFCKQQKSLESTRFLAKAMGTKISHERFYVQYRGDGWPGVVSINDKNIPYHRAAQLPFGRRLWSVPGCNICGDPFGFGAEADVSLMDPWEIRQPNDLGETLVTVGSEVGLRLVLNSANLTLESKSYDEILPALGLKDIERKQRLVPYFRGEECSSNVRRAGRMEQLQRRYLQALAMGLPRVPFIVVRKPTIK